MRKIIKTGVVAALLAAGVIAAPYPADAAPPADTLGFLSAVHHDGIGGADDLRLIQWGTAVCDALRHGYLETAITDAVAATNPMMTRQDARTFVYDAEINLCPPAAYYTMG